MSDIPSNLKAIINRLRNKHSDPVAFQQHAESDIFYLLELVDDLAPGPDALAGLVRKPIAGTYTDHEGEYSVRMGLGGVLN